MFILSFSASPAQLGDAFTTVTRLSTSLEKWNALRNALDAIMKRRFVATPEDTAELERAAWEIACGGLSAGASIGIHVDRVSFDLTNGQFIYVRSEPRFLDQLTIQTRLADDQAIGVVTSLIKSGIGFSGSPSIQVVNGTDQERK
jgi:hypothetical protein